jgi:non-ribosomal peptide synthetase component F
VALAGQVRGLQLALRIIVLRAIHRLIEGHVTTNGDAVAVVEGDRYCSYRELNAAANAFARRLITGGFRRGMRADVRMIPSVDLAVVLLAILKTGGCYRWSHADAPSFQIATDDESLSLPVDDIPVKVACGGPNLPVITRETDIACVLDRPAGEDSIAVPHATIIAMAPCATTGRWPWAGEPGAFDLWAALLCGATAVTSSR